VSNCLAQLDTMSTKAIIDAYFHRTWIS